MNTRTHPGKDLSLPQLLFALNEELRRVAYSPLFTLEAVSQLEQDASTALAKIREWKNSFTPINRMPFDVLSLIPTYLTSQKDRFHAASVCRYWRGTLLKHGVLWAQLFLRKGEEYVSTLLERAKGSALDIIVHQDIPDGTVSLISPHAQQIRYLEFTQSCLQDIVVFSELNSGQLPLLHTLKITTDESGDRPHPITLFYPFFRGSVNLEQFTFDSSKLWCLDLFAFPNLTTLDLSVCPAEQTSVLPMLNFLKASPLLRTAELYTSWEATPNGIPQEMVVTLPNVQTFSLRVLDDLTIHLFEIAAHISCPRAKDILLVHSTFYTHVTVDLEMFPSSVLWDRIVHQYPTNAIEEVTLEITHGGVECYLTFRSSGATAIRLGFEVDETGRGDMSFEDMGWEALSQAFSTIRDHPLLSHIKRLHIRYRASMSDDAQVIRVADKVKGLFRSLGPLDELSIRGCDLSIFFVDFLDSLEPPYLGEPTMLPWIKKLMIVHPLMDYDRELECLEAIARLAKAQHALGIPFESVAIRGWVIPTWLEEELEKWVNVVECRQGFPDTDSEWLTWGAV